MEIHSNQFLILALAPNTVVAPDPAGAAAAVDATQAERFRTLVQGEAVAPAAAEGHMAVGMPPPPPGPPANMGEAILKGMDELRADFRNTWESVTKLGGPEQPAVSPHELFQFQLKVIESSFHYEMVGKVVSKAEQNLEQIVKMQ
ncbi:EscI/YscI/HrpB family type III secretion system inner rod protein [Pseudothauera rhizosphaerae]|uniref:Uncharacterized protein n=1 Tax=Pseudothauera rhizosphaerae TaxID=2565932 RepID=A0A4S4ADU2_9RHOO|nr:EscI/YscI/HrpB family type III secretion system inner rod protein [Pseudothauera rhizosphaerae]THF57272.1 hypothetical protein E6O51_18420 [Pseudothauera rhizosphaerae]